MDLLDFAAEDLYYAGEQSAQVTRLVAEAYGRGEAESLLLRACFLAPEDLSVLVALYRYYYYQHRYEDALLVAHRALGVSAERLGINSDWMAVNQRDLNGGAARSMSLMRFYLYALKGAGYLKLRLGDTEGGARRLGKVVELDEADRIGAKGLLEVVCGRSELSDDQTATAG
jgi:hypothetical protein